MYEPFQKVRALKDTTDLKFAGQPDDAKWPSVRALAEAAVESLPHLVASSMEIFIYSLRPEEREALRIRTRKPRRKIPESKVLAQRQEPPPPKPVAPAPKPVQGISSGALEDWGLRRVMMSTPILGD